MTDKRAAFEEMNRRHQVSRAYFFSQKEFRRQFNIHLPIGLCAGLVQVWWAELRKGNDAIRRLEEATPQLVGEVLLSQARSVYLKEFPPHNRELRTHEAELLEFKYGEHGVAPINSLCTLFGVDNCLELDLGLLHDSPIIKRWRFSHLASDIVDALTEGPSPGLYVLLARYWDSKRASGERGHRSALVIEAGGSCRFYDPQWGEMSFLALDQFTGWFTEYWTTQLWDYYLQRGSPPSSPVQLFAFGGTFPPAAMEKSLALRERFSNPDPRELILWLDGLRPRPAGEHGRGGDLTPQQVGRG
ncbi:MAG: hypothetical protein H0X14_08755 [Acidobacteria bacterium]|nr:hypothetical protein [Acidobacteriota bacterium]